MKNASKLLAMLLAVAMFAAVAFTVSAFDDVTVENDCYEAVNTLVSLEVIKGKTETEFAPDDSVTREQMAALMSRLYTTVASEGGPNVTPFNDLDDPYYNYVISWCYDAGVINGTSPTTFEPKGNIILQDAVTMAARLLGYNDLSYPLGYITKGRLIGLLDGLEGVAYDKELTRGETAILLFNALTADGDEIIMDSKVEEYGAMGFPILVQYERHFTIAQDVYNFKTQRYQIVGTENFKFDSYAAGDKDAYNLVKVTAKGVRTGNAELMNFEDIAVAEGTNGDDNILAFIDILFKGDSLDDPDAVVLSSAIVSNLNPANEVAVYFKENTNGKLIAQDDKILIDGKAYEADDYIYVVTPATSTAAATINTWTYNATTKTLADVAPVFYQTNANDEGLYAEKLIDLDNDGDIEVIMFFPVTLNKVNSISSKGVYKVDTDVHSSTSGDVVSFDTSKDDCNLVFLVDEVAKDDYVLTYTDGYYTYVYEVLEPVFATITRKTSSTSGYRYTLSTGDVLTFATANNPIGGPVPVNNSFTLDGEEKALYVVNNKIVYSSDANAIGYTPYTYAFVITDADTEKYVDPETGKKEEINNMIAVINGKAVTIPTKTSYPSSFHAQMVTVKGINDGKYELVNGLEVKNSSYEMKIMGGTISWDDYSKTYKFRDAAGKYYICSLDADSEIYVRKNNDEGDYETFKRFTMANTPAKNFSETLESAILRMNSDADGVVRSYTLVVAFATETAGNEFATNDADYQSYRLVLETGLSLDAKGDSYPTYDLMNPVTGAIETVVDTTVTAGTTPSFVAGDMVNVRSNGRVSRVYGLESVFTGGSNLHAQAKVFQVASIYDDKLISVYTDTTATTIFTTDWASEFVIKEGMKIVVLDYNDDGVLEIDVTEDYTDTIGKVAYIYARDVHGLSPYYFVVLPYEWLLGADSTLGGGDDLFTNLEAYPEHPNYNN
ncbi:MAG: S-layer homology domain-containing protein [Clostridia bacterium]|nr:S-layer homology domain-containing protein [Clostridia bacterium]